MERGSGVKYFYFFFVKKKKKKLFKSSSLKPLNQIKPNLAEMVLD
jgi:hypothetical protein